MPGLIHHPEAIPALAREQFPALTASPGVAYLDSAATTQKPRQVIDAVAAALAVQTANPGRGGYPWSSRGARRIAEIRERAARFIGASGPEEIVFTPGATAGLNAVALSWGLANLADGDEILYSPNDHSSNVYPWWHLRQVLAGFGRLDPAACRVLEATTTDIEPMEIFRIGVEATARTLVQHACLADQTPYRTPAQFARGLRDSAVFAVASGTWYWELQASTFRRGMIPVSFAPGPDGTVRYPAETVAMLRAMKEATIAQAHAVMTKAVSEENLTVAEAVRKYYHDLDLVAKQYALLPVGEQPRCLAQMTHAIDGQRFSVQPGVVIAYVETFARLLDLVQITLLPGVPEEEITDPGERTFHVPDMNCKHCRATITTLLESMDAPVAEIDLVTKRVVAGFRTVAARERAFDAIRDSGYTVVPPR